MLAHWYTLLFLKDTPEPKKIGSHGVEKNRYLTGYEVDRFSDFVIQPKIKLNNDDDLLIICMMQ